MVLQLTEELAIENLGNYSTETVDRLRELLATGVLAHVDPRRKNFYELEDDCQVFYVNLIPSKSKVLLLATWKKDCPDAT